MGKTSGKQKWEGKGLEKLVEFNMNTLVIKK